MKLNLLVKLSSVFILILLFGCEEEEDRLEPFYGTWYAIACSSNGGPYNCGYPYPMPRGTKTLVLNSDKTYTLTDRGYFEEGTFVIEKDLFSSSMDPNQPKDVIKFNGDSGGYYIELKNEKLNLRTTGCCMAYTYEK
jgi:hypothetical protein